MRLKIITRVGVAYFIGLTGGWLFSIAHFPIPWILGPLSLILVYKTFLNKSVEAPLSLRNISFTIMGIQIGNTFTTSTLDNVLPYLIPYSILTLVIIATSLVLAYILTKWIPIDPTTSMLGSVPGGLSVIIALSETLKGNTALVTIFHTIRLMTVLFFVPIVAVSFFTSKGKASTPLDDLLITVDQGSLWTISIYLILFVIALYLQKWVPAALVIVPMLVVGTLQIINQPMYILPSSTYIFAQITIGIYLGHSIQIKDLTKAGKYCLYYFTLTLVIILLSFSFGYVFSLVTDMDLPTSILSFAPGGLIEMAVTAESINGDPSIVSSLQMIRMLTIVIILPLLLQRLIPKLTTKQ